MKPIRPLLFVLVACGGPGPDAFEVEVTAPDRVWWGKQDADVAGQTVDLGGYGLGVGTPSMSRSFGPPQGGAYLLEGDVGSGWLDRRASTTFPPSTTHLYGLNVVLPGDLTGDGVPDLTVTGVDEDEDPLATALVFEGPFDSEERLASTAWFKVLQSGVGGQGAYYTTACGDVDDDGANDLCVGLQSGLHSTVAEAAIFFGPLGNETRRVDTADAIVEAELGSRLGEALAGGEDVNGDGVPDVVLGAFLRDERRGALALWSDPRPGRTHMDDLQTWRGEVAGGQAGQQVAMGGDLDGDGTADFFAGAPQTEFEGLEGRSGRGYVVVDATGGDLADAHLRLDAAGDGDWFGFGASIGDLDGDGAADLAVGAPHDVYADDGVPGTVSVWLGPLDPGQRDATTADLHLRGSDAPDGFGWALDIGDLEGDGVPELVVGAPYDDQRAEDGGAVYLFRSADLF